VSRADCAAAATATWNRDSARRRASASGARRSSEVRARAEHGDVVVGQVAQLRRGHLAQPFAQHVGRPAADVAHEAAARAAPPRDDELLPAQDRERLPHRHRRHAERLRQLGLARQLLARPQQAEADALGEAADHGVGATAEVERGENRRAAAGVTHGLHPAIAR
jgi:hypothetical protein